MLITPSTPVLISTHALTEGDNPYLHRCNTGKGFQLTPSRRATVSSTYIPSKKSYFNSRPHGGRRLTLLLLYFGVIFQLTPSRRATITLHARLHFHFISTHALTEGDSTLWPTATSIVAFQLTPSRRATVLRLDVRKL